MIERISKPLAARWSAGTARITMLAVALTLHSASAAAWPQTEFSQHVIEQTKQSVSGELAKQGLRWGAPAYIRIFKESNELELWLKNASRYQLFKTYDICGMSGELGPKLAEGDLQAPEGFYFINELRLNPWSSYHLSMNIGYPNAYDRAHQRSGSALMVHGTCLSLGCFAIGDSSIEQLYSLVDASLRAGSGIVRVHAFPFRMSKQRLAEARGSQWHSFWENLKVGYDWFERHKVPPNTNVKNQRYVFSSGR